jgi:hypothetical protein
MDRSRQHQDKHLRSHKLVLVESFASNRLEIDYNLWASVLTHRKTGVPLALPVFVQPSQS